METKEIHIETPLDVGVQVLLSPRHQVHLNSLKHSDVYRKLAELGHLVSLFSNFATVFGTSNGRLLLIALKGWKSEAGNTYFRKQRDRADNATKKVAKRFFCMMQSIARELNDATDLFNIAHSEREVASVLDWCMAPGGFLRAVLQHNHGSRCRAFSLPCADGGHEVFLSSKEKADITFLDLNLLAADMGIKSIPPAHPEAESFLPRQVEPGEVFDLVICDGQVLRTHKRPGHRERLESTRLVLVQLALGLEHVREGGKMVILLQKSPSRISTLQYVCFVRGLVFAFFGLIFETALLVIAPLFTFYYLQEFIF